MLKRHRGTSTITRTYGTDDFAATLAEREAALGIAPNYTRVTQAYPGDGDTVSAETPADAGTMPPLPGTSSAASTDGIVCDRFGNEVISGDAEDGPHIIRSMWDGRLIRVCGEYRSGKHLVWWTFDEAEMRPICSLCFGWQPQQPQEQEKGWY